MKNHFIANYVQNHSGNQAISKSIKEFIAEENSDEESSYFQIPTSKNFAKTTYFLFYLFCNVTVPVPLHVTVFLTINSSFFKLHLSYEDIMTNNHRNRKSSALLWGFFIYKLPFGGSVGDVIGESVEVELTSSSSSASRGLMAQVSTLKSNSSKAM